MTARRWRLQAGFTLIEVMVAALVLILGFTALATVFITGQSQASANVQQTQLIGIADQEIEQVRAAVASQGFDALGMSGTPTVLSSRVVHSTWFDPDEFVTAAGCYVIATNYDLVNTAASTPFGVSAPPGFIQWSACGAGSDAEPLTELAARPTSPIIAWSSTVAECGSGAQVNVPCWVPLTSGCTTTATTIIAVPACAATVYAFVTDSYVGCDSSTAAVSCPTSSGGVLDCPGTSLPSSTAASTPCGDARRVTIAVVPNGSHELGRATPVYLSTLFTNPEPSTSNAGPAGLTLHLNL